MTDIDKRLFDLYDIARKRDIMVSYGHLPDRDSFITSINDKSYIFLDLSLNGRKESEKFAHETAHDFVGISSDAIPEWLNELFERKAKIWTAVYLVPYSDVIKTLFNPHINNEWEAAQWFGVDIEIFLTAVEYYMTQGLPIMRYDVVNWWDFEKGDDI